MTWTNEQQFKLAMFAVFGVISILLAIVIGTTAVENVGNGKCDKGEVITLNGVNVQTCKSHAR